MKKRLFILLIFISSIAIAQNNCVDAIVVCGNGDYVDLSAVGIGFQELSGSNTCGSRENNSIWFNIKINTGGTLGFTLTPTLADGTPNKSIVIDFDFFVFGPNVSCGNIGQAIRCSTTNPQAASQGNNLTGMKIGESDVSEGPGPDGNSFVSLMNVAAGDSYFLVVDRPIGSSNFKIDWTGSATFNEPPVANQPTIGTTYDMKKCDTEGDGIIDSSAVFDLSVTRSSLIGTQSGIIVTYHLNNTDAQVGNNKILTPASFRSTSLSQTIYARITSVITDCFSVAEFNLTVINTLEMTVEDINQCDDNNDGFSSFDLTQNDDTIVNDRRNMQVSYHKTENEAINGINPIIGLYQNTTNPEVIWTRLENISGCYGIENFQIEVFDSPAAITPSEMVLCDDDNNGTMPFNLISQNNNINTDSGITITYHISQVDANDNVNAISSPFESGSATIFARVESNVNPSCFDTTSFDIEVYESPFPLESTSISPIQDCDNTSVGTYVDGFIVFDLTQRETDILSGQSAADFTLTYFTDSGYTLPIVVSTAYANEVVRKQTIFVRMTNNIDAFCFADTSFEIEVLELPVLNTAPYILEQCDDDFDGFNIFNLTEINTDILTNITSEVFTYFEFEADAITGNSPIIDSITYTNEIANVDDTLWVRIENSDGCFRVTQIILIVKPSAIPTSFLREFFECDGGDNTIDGISTFDFSSVTAEIEAIFPVDIDVFYYENEADATSEINEVPDPSNYQNINSPNVQEIWARADSSLGNDCLGNGHHITLTVHPLPQFEVEPTAFVCLNLPPTALEIFNPSGDYTYEWTYPNGDVIMSPAATVSLAGVYRVVANYTTTSGSVCQSLPRIITVSESIIATITLDDVTITDDSENNTITIDTSNLGIGDYEFALDDEFGFYQEEPFFDMVASGVHEIYVRDKNNCGVAVLEVSVIGFPNFFTPNNDGHNDNWQIKGVSKNFYPTSLIYIYDRFGKIITKVDPTSDGWNGFYNGQALPATDYWFSVQLIDGQGNTRNRNGHFSLVR